MQPFKVAIPQTELDDLKRRLEHTRWPDELPGMEGKYGVSLRQVQRLVDYWRMDYNWREHEAHINRYPQFTTEIDGQTIHFLHVISLEPEALPLILTHGWPNTVIEYLEVIGPLTNPSAHDAPGRQAFHLVIPSLPGFGFSGPTREPGWDKYRIARAWKTLMARLGYTHYGAHGNDVGSNVSPELGRADSEHVIGVHVTQIFSFPSGDPAEFARLSETDVQRAQELQTFWREQGAFNLLQSSQPQTIATALADSPAGLLTWMEQLFGEAVSDDYALTNASIYWLTNTAASSARLYYEDMHSSEKPTAQTMVPLGLASFAWDFKSIRGFAERDHANIVQWNEYDRGSHYAAHDAPDLLLEDIRAFFERLR